MKTFKGLSLTPSDAFKNIEVLLEAGLLLSVIDFEDKSNGGDYVLNLAIQYANAAHKKSLENKQ